MSNIIDRAGRLVIPKNIRDEVKVIAVSELEIDYIGGEIHLRVARTAPRFIRKDGVLFFEGGGGEADIDLAAFINREREK